MENSSEITPKITPEMVSEKLAQYASLSGAKRAPIIRWLRTNKDEILMIYNSLPTTEEQRLTQIWQ